MTNPSIDGGGVSKLEVHYCAESGCIRQIYKPNLYCDKHQDKSSNPNLMTGQEWYDRLLNQLGEDIPKLEENDLVGAAVLKAAKKASGL